MQCHVIHIVDQEILTNLYFTSYIIFSDFIEMQDYCIHIKCLQRIFPDLDEKLPTPTNIDLGL